MINNTCTVIVYDPVRKKEWEEILGTNEVPAISLLAKWGNFPIVGKELYYECDLDRLTPRQKRRLTVHISRKFHIPLSEVRSEIDKHGIPILMKDCVGSDEMRKYY